RGRPQVMGYRSPFDQWDEKAAVRTMPATDRRWAPDAEGSWFGAESWSAANHPEVLASGRRQQVLAALLLGYLDFTLQLETHHIAPVSRDLVLRRLGGPGRAAGAVRRGVPRPVLRGAGGARGAGHRAPARAIPGAPLLPARPRAGGARLRADERAPVPVLRGGGGGDGDHRLAAEGLE